jgi:hypothetical protein
VFVRLVVAGFLLAHGATHPGFLSKVALVAAWAPDQLD